MSSSDINHKTTLSKNIREDYSNKLPSGCIEPSTSCFVPTGRITDKSDSWPIFESDFVVISATCAPIEFAFSASKRRCSVEPDLERIINHYC